MFQSLLRRSRNGDRGAEATPNSNQPIVERPTIGLALGGGAARGFAHIGVLRVLLANNIVPDVVVGTSIGAVVGGCYTSGQLDTLETWACQLTKRGILGYLDVSFSGAGLISGNRLASRLEEALGDIQIDRLKTRFAAITTEVSSGHEIWLTRGRMVEAMRASYALPGIFPPVRLGGRWLVDGALVNPVPVSAARALGARLVIAINLNADMLGRGSTIASHGTDETDERLREQLAKSRNGLRAMFGPERALKRQFIDAGRPGIPTVMVEAFNIMQDRITRARLAGDPPDVLISPRLGEIGWFDFHRAQQAIEIGETAAKRALEPVAEAINALSTYSPLVTGTRT